MNQKVIWKEVISDNEWDAALARLHGHPLQSAVWGNAKRVSDQIQDHRWVAYLNDKPVFQARFEERRILKFIKVAWVPRGPAFSDEIKEDFIKKEFFNRLKKNSFSLYVDCHWKQINVTKMKRRYHYTMWIDLTLGKNQLWNKLSKQCRYDVRRADKLGVGVTQSVNSNDIKDFYKLCVSVSMHKNFDLDATERLMAYLIENQNDSIGSHLFIAHHNEKIIGGAFVVRCGKNIHYLWGAIDRQLSKLAIGEILQWKIIEWAISQGYEVYDLEGINYKKNPGTFHFKKKLGGEVIILPGIKFYFINRIIQAFFSFFKINAILSSYYG